MNVGATALHASEPGHLALGKLVYGGLKLSEHLIVGELSYYMKGNKLVFLAVID